MKLLLALALVTALGGTAGAQTATPSDPYVIVVLEASDNLLVYPDAYELTATLSASSQDTPGSCIAEQEVTFLGQVFGHDDFEVIGTVTTNQQGVATIPLPGLRSTTYIAEVEQSVCLQATSNAEPVRVRKRVNLKLMGETERRTRLVVGVGPCGGHQDDKAILLKRKDGEWVRVAAKRPGWIAGRGSHECEGPTRRARRRPTPITKPAGHRSCGYFGTGRRLITWGSAGSSSRSR